MLLCVLIMGPPSSVTVWNLGFGGASIEGLKRGSLPAEEEEEEAHCVSGGVQNAQGEKGSGSQRTELGDEGGPPTVLDVDVHPVHEVDVRVRQRPGRRLPVGRRHPRTLVWRKRAGGRTQRASSATLSQLESTVDTHSTHQIEGKLTLTVESLR